MTLVVFYDTNVNTDKYMLKIKTLLRKLQCTQGIMMTAITKLIGFTTTEGMQQDLITGPKQQNFTWNGKVITSS